MALVDNTIANLMGGVSQQPALLRFSNQCELEENILATLGDGLINRPPLEWINSLSTNTSDAAFTHIIDVGGGEKYIMIITSDATNPIEVFTLEGQPCTVLYNNPEAKVYLTESNPRETFRAVTVAAYTIVVNKNVICEYEDTIVDPQTPTGVIYIKRGVDKCDYKVHINGTQVATYSSDTTASTPKSAKTNDIAQSLYDQMVSGIGADYNLTRMESTIIVTRKNGASFDIKCYDSQGDTAIIGFTGACSKFTDLPAKATDGLIIEITGDEMNQFDNYFVQYISSRNVWGETVKRGIKNIIDGMTMPHKIVLDSYDAQNLPVFSVSQIDWSQRNVGDENSAPDPTFIGSTINDIFFFKNRLGFLSGENAILSMAGEYFNFFPGTALEIMDDDPVDVSVSSNILSLLDRAVPYQNNVVLFSDQQQFNLSSGQLAFAPSTASIDTTTAFETDTHCKPILAGANIYFVVPSGQYSTIREYFTSQSTLTHDAEDVTIQVPRYLPKNIVTLAASTSKDILFVLSKDNPKELYVYKYYWANGGEKKQSCWNKWVFDDEIINMAVIYNYLYLLQSKEDQVFLTRCNLERTNTGNLPFRVHLDKMSEIIPTYDDATNKSTWTLPYTDSAKNFLVVDAETGTLLSRAVKDSDSTITCVGNYSSKSYYVGKTYVCRHRLSEWFVKPDGNAPSLQNKLTIKQITVFFEKTGYFRIELTPWRGITEVKEYTGAVIGESTIGTPSMLSGRVDYSFNSDAHFCTIDLVSDSYKPFTFVAVSVVGEENSHTRQV